MPIYRIAATAFVLAAALPIAAARGQAFNDSYSFGSAVLAARHPSVTETFDALDWGQILPNGTTMSGMTFTFPAWTQGMASGMFAHAGNHGLTVHEDGTPDWMESWFFSDEGLQINFTAPVLGVGACFYQFGLAPAGSFGISTPVGSATNDGSYWGGCQFIGLLSTTPFTAAYLGGLSGYDFTGFTLDNITYVQDVLLPPPPYVAPEPTSLALVTLGGGVMLLCLCRRTRHLG